MMKDKKDKGELKKPSDYRYTSVAVLPSTKQRLLKLARRLHLPIYQLVDLLVSEFMEDLHDNKIKVKPDEIDEKDKQIFKEFKKLQH